MGDDSESRGAIRALEIVKQVRYDPLAKLADEVVKFIDEERAERPSRKKEDHK